MSYNAPPAQPAFQTYTTATPPPPPPKPPTQQQRPLHPSAEAPSLPPYPARQQNQPAWQEQNTGHAAPGQAETQGGAGEQYRYEAAGRGATAQYAGGKHGLQMPPEGWVPKELLDLSYTTRPPYATIPLTPS